LPAYPADTNAVVLLDDTSYVIADAGERVAHRRRVVKILRPDGRAEAALGVSFGQGDKVASIHAWTIDKAGRELELRDKDFMEGSSFSFELYSDDRYRRAMAPAAYPGSVIGFELEMRERAWVNQVNWTYQEGVPVLEASLSVELPPGWQFGALWSAGAKHEPVKVGASSWRWTFHDVPRIDDEPRMPAFGSLTARMELNYFPPGDTGTSSGSWDGIGKWYTSLIAERGSPSPELSERVRQLIQGKPDFESRVAALASFIQSEIRYVAIEIGIGGYQPHAAADVFKARYGDCKDKANLLGVMLELAGIHGRPLVIHTLRGVADPAIPSLFSFNHMVIAIELPEHLSPPSYHSGIVAKSGKRYLLFDPTDQYTPLGSLRSELQDTYALLVTDRGGEMIRTPIQSPETSRLTRTGSFRLDAEGTLTGQIVETRSGDHASRLRFRLHEDNERERTERVERVLNASLKGFTLEDTAIDQLDPIQKDLIVRYRFSAPQYAQIMEPMLLVRPCVVGAKSFDVANKLRRYAFELDGPSRELDSYEIEVPASYRVDDIPAPTRIDMGFLSYESSIVVVNASKLRYTRELIVRDLSVAPERIAELRKFEGLIRADETSAVVLKRLP
jgi:transglutaminase-like putative cysteine protease